MTDAAVPVVEAHAEHAAILRFAHGCLSGVLQLDYLSNGAGHRQSTALFGGYGARVRGDARRADFGALHDEAAPSDDPKAEVEAEADGDVAHDDVGNVDEAAHDAGAVDAEAPAYLDWIDARRRLSSSEEYRLARAASDGDEAARRELIESHLGFVVMIARRYPDHALPLSDRIEEGNIGLLTAIEKFDPELGYRFSTYAKWWVRQSIELAMMTQARVVHVPVYVTRAMKRSARDAAAGKTTEDAGDADVLRDVHHCLLFDASDHGPSGAEARDGADAMLDALPAPEDERPDRVAQMESQRRRIEGALQRLNDNERAVVRGRYGLDGDDVRTLESLAAELGLSSERVRQIQAAVLTKLHRILDAQGLGSAQLLCRSAPARDPSRDFRFHASRTACRARAGAARPARGPLRARAAGGVAAWRAGHLGRGGLSPDAGMEPPSPRPRAARRSHACGRRQRGIARAGHCRDRPHVVLVGRRS